MERALAEVFGFVMVQVGGWGVAGELVAARRTASWVEAATVPGTGAGDGGTALPFESEAVDAVVLPHTLESAESPHEVVREAERILAGDGHLIVLGFSPWSLWGARRHVGPLRFPFDQSNCISDARLGDWLALLGLETIAVHRHLHGLPLESESGLKRAAFLERWGARSWPRLAGAYVLVARKRRHSLTPLRAVRERSVPPFGATVTVRRSALVQRDAA